MIQVQQHQVTEKVFSAQQSISVNELIVKLSHLCEQRHHANSFYPYAPGAQKRFETIHQIRIELGNVLPMQNDHEQVKTCLRLELAFHSLANNPTKKLHLAYRKQIDDLMEACRFFLGRRKQA